MPLRMGDFTCIKANDVFTRRGCGGRCTLYFEVFDRRNNTRRFDSGGQDAGGILSMLNTMNKVASYDDWNDWDRMKELLKAHNLTPGDLATMVKSLLAGTGIIFKNT